VYRFLKHDQSGARLAAAAEAPARPETVFASSLTTGSRINSPRILLSLMRPEQSRSSTPRASTTGAQKQAGTQNSELERPPKQYPSRSRLSSFMFRAKDAQRLCSSGTDSSTRSSTVTYSGNSRIRVLNRILQVQYMVLGVVRTGKYSS